MLKHNEQFLVDSCHSAVKLARLLGTRVKSVGIEENGAGGAGWGHSVSTLHNKLKNLEFFLQWQRSS